MKKNKKIQVLKELLVLIFVVIATIALTLFAVKKDEGYEKYEIIDEAEALTSKLSNIKNVLDKLYIGEQNNEEMIDSAIRGYVDGVGDEYTTYLNEKDLEDFMQDVDGNYVGIGIYMGNNTKEDRIVVIMPIENGSAEEAGILPGDLILKVDGVEYKGDETTTASSKIKGEEGTTVNLEIQRDGKVFDIDIKRRKIELYPVKSKIIDNVGYIYFPSFNENVSQEFNKKYKELLAQNVKGLVIDIRNNTGGYVDEAISIAEMFTEKGTKLLITKDKDGNETITKASKNPEIKIPTIIIGNENSASASEILIGALKDNGKVKFVGETTYGKGVIQRVVNLVTGGALKVTTNEYHTPNGDAINGIGITPDYEEKLPENKIFNTGLKLEEDTQLKKALELLK